MSLPDMIFIFGLVLVIFGPKKLPEISRQIGKMMFEFRRASNEFKMQIDEELRAAEQAERQKALSAPASTPTPVSETAASTTPTIMPPSVGTQVSTNSPTHSAIQPVEAASFEPPPEPSLLGTAPAVNGSADPAASEQAGYPEPPQRLRSQLEASEPETSSAAVSNEGQTLTHHG